MNFCFKKYMVLGEKINQNIWFWGQKLTRMVSCSLGIQHSTNFEPTNYSILSDGEQKKLNWEEYFLVASCRVGNTRSSQFLTEPSGLSKKKKKRVLFLNSSIQFIKKKNSSIQWLEYKKIILLIHLIWGIFLNY